MSGRILVVDDNADAANQLGELLRLCGEDVNVCYDGQAALELIARRRPQVVYLDLAMPGLDGFEVARKVRQMEGGAGVRLIALSGWSREADRARSRAAGFDYFIAKPIEYEVLRKSLDLAKH